MAEPSDRSPEGPAVVQDMEYTPQASGDTAQTNDNGSSSWIRESTTPAPAPVPGLFTGDAPANSKEQDTASMNERHSVPPVSVHADALCARMVADSVSAPHTADKAASVVMRQNAMVGRTAGSHQALQEMFKTGTAIVYIETSDNKIFEVESRVAFVSPALCRGFDPAQPKAPVKLTNISSHVLERILEYCRFHTATGRSAKESRAFDKRFAKVDRATMCELASAAYYMELEPLIDLTCKAIASSIDWSSPEAIRDAFGLPDDLTEEEKLEPIACEADDLRTKQYNNLLARKRKQLADSKAGSGKQASKCREEDSRSVDELLAFIGEEPDANKKKKGKRKGKKKAKPERSCDEVSEVHDANPSSAVTVDKGEKLELAARLANITVDDMSEIFNEFDDDDGLDPELKEKHERELAEFSKTLGLVPSVGCEQ